MERGCLLLIISLMTLQESASKSTPSDWRAPTNNLTGNPWPWALGVSTPQNFYDSLYNHYAPITNFQVDVPEISTAEPMKGTNTRAVAADEKLLKRIEDLQKLVDQLTTNLASANSDISNINTELGLGHLEGDDIVKAGIGAMEQYLQDLAGQTAETEDQEKKKPGKLKRKVEWLVKELADQTKKTEDLEAELKKEVESREAEDGKIKTEINSVDGRLEKTEKKKAVCGFKKSTVFSSKDTTLSFDRVYDEVDSTSSEGTLEKNGYFKAGVAGIYYISVEAWVGLHKGEYFDGNLVLSTGSYANDGDFINSSNYYGDVIIAEQSSASRYVRMAAGETLRISLNPHHGSVDLHNAIMCVSLYSASG